MGIKQRLISPTYSLIREYSGRYPLVHVDCYRLTGEEDAIDIGLGEILGRSTIVLVEWPEKIERLLPDTCLKIHITIIDEATRLISIAAKTPG
jgi:tRNA threonylcarbamoyladenosine biosynthesis protein TsaE